MGKRGLVWHSLKEEEDGEQWKSGKFYIFFNDKIIRKLGVLTKYETEKLIYIFLNENKMKRNLVFCDGPQSAIIQTFLLVPKD